MSKAEEFAYSKYPKDKKGVLYDLARNSIIQGYQQAEKDLELTWEDMRIILDAEIDILRECNSQKELVIETYPKGEDYYSEILKRFKDFKEDT